VNVDPTRLYSVEEISDPLVTLRRQRLLLTNDFVVSLFLFGDFLFEPGLNRSTAFMGNELHLRSSTR
jgi:hypothetical protein